ncbi:DUF938 domain-containing protein [Alterisphingorhabdus coralli]|uniref:DUF938 domain-containing protein n=1 Tax=Alterisphingorhabdus coralli TaxID=3071408 RepID=A0AA97F548_9SPHN|nr:DUF938 domain-containing protein [Parasphingorhabdus sp. SCSIO 66989]WOE74191.1 DUF938 domain-containing protein [Parasphingorhabdus sp. SCSIO 66989]
MADSTPWIASEAGPEDRKFSAAAERNKQVIADILLPLLPHNARVLEIASGSGQHVTHFAARRPDITWQPSDVSSDALRSIAAWTAESGQGENVSPPVHLDLLDSDAAGLFDVTSFDAILCANLLHISPWEATEALFKCSAQWLGRNGLLFVYGPFLQANVGTAPSNIAFDQNLRSRDQSWGIRALEDVSCIATKQGFAEPMVTVMPANNLSLMFRRVSA